MLDNDVNNGDGPLTVTDFVALAPSIGTLTIDANGDYLVHACRRLERLDEHDLHDHATTTANPRTATSRSPSRRCSDAPSANDDTVTVDEDIADRRHGPGPGQRHRPRWRHAVGLGRFESDGRQRRPHAGVVTFTPTADLCGDDVGSFDYDISDGHGGSDSASATVDITCLNEAPVAVDDTVTVDEDTPTDVTSTLLANDTDANGDTLTVSDVSNAAGGSVDLTAGVVTFTPDRRRCAATAMVPSTTTSATATAAATAPA